jgi:hypothetical protein
MQGVIASGAQVVVRADVGIVPVVVEVVEFFVDIIVVIEVFIIVEIVIIDCGELPSDLPFGEHAPPPFIIGLMRSRPQG